MTPPKKPRAFQFTLPIANLLFGGVIAVGCNREADRSINEEPKTPVSATIERVTAGLPIKKTLRLFTEQPGRVEAFEETPIFSKIPGYVKSIHFDIGDKVKKGETVIELYAPEYSDQVEQKKGLMEQAQAQVKQAEAGLLAAQASLNSSKAIIAQAEATNNRTEAEYARWESENSRIQQLVSKGSVTPKLADETASKLQAARAAKDEAIATIDSTKAREQEADANMSKARADLDAAHAKLKTAVADFHQAETMLNYTTLTSSFDGYVINRNVDLGHYVQPANSNSAQPLMTIVNADKVRVFVSIPESEANWVDAGFEDLTKGDLATISFGAAMNR
ncbi:MAG: HlyD family secretion protein, partial [Pirellula sp.]